MEVERNEKIKSLLTSCSFKNIIRPGFLQKYSFYFEFLQEATYNAIISHVAEAKSSTLDFCKSHNLFIIGGV